MVRAISIQEHPTQSGTEYIVRYDDNSVIIFPNYPTDDDLTL